MSKNPEIPETWGIPDDQSNKVREAPSKKSIRPEDGVQKALVEIARDIAIIEPDPVDWGWWVIYLLEQMEAEAERRGKSGDYGEMLRSLKQELDNRISLG